MPWPEAIHGDTVVVSGKEQPSVFNRFNRASFEGRNFGIVTGLDENGVPAADTGVNMPKLFSDGPDAEVQGKTTHNDLGLKFLRYGNTFTLGEVIGTDVTNLDSFGHPGIYDGIQNKTCIWTNNFWPMDGKVQDGDGHDPVFGKYDQKANVVYEKIYYAKSATSSDLMPKSDDALNHNSYFGMQFEVGFDLPASYIGPLDYTFFGDDDMWVFLDGKQIVDIGGVHRSVGMYVDLWDYLSREDAGSHKLSFFFTERGASGSTCWMNFCLPNIKTTSGPDVTPTGSLRIEKQVTGEGAETDKDFEFEVTLDLTNAEGTVEDRIYNYYGSRIGSIRSGETLRLKADEYVVIEDIPAGTKYRVRELEATGYIPTYSDTSEGTMGEELVTVSVLNERISGPLLPETGGPGVTPYYFMGGLLVYATALPKSKRRTKIQASQRG